MPAQKSTTPNEDLIIAAAAGDQKRVAAALAAGADINYRRTDLARNNAVDIAAEYGRMDMVRFLFDQGAEGLSADSSLTLAELHNAGRSDMIALLLEKSEKFNAADPDCSLQCLIPGILGTAISEARLDIVELLLKRGVNVHTGGGRGLRRGVAAAFKASRFDIMDQLLDRAFSPIKKLAPLDRIAGKIIAHLTESLKADQSHLAEAIAKVEEHAFKYAQPLRAQKASAWAARNTKIKPAKPQPL